MSSVRPNPLFFPALILAGLALAGCNEPPQVAIDAAATKLAEAESAQAATYAPDQHAQATAAMEAVRAEVAAQGEKFALFRSYDRTAELVAEAEREATAAREAAAAGREQAKIEAEAALESLRAGVAQAQALHGDLGKCRRRPKGFAADLEALEGRLSGLAGQVVDVEAAIAGDDFLGAKALATAVGEQVATLSAELSDAKVKLGC